MRKLIFKALRLAITSSFVALYLNPMICVARPLKIHPDPCLAPQMHLDRQQASLEASEVSHQTGELQACLEQFIATGERQHLDKAVELLQGLDPSSRDFYRYLISFSHIINENHEVSYLALLAQFLPRLEPYLDSKEALQAVREINRTIQRYRALDCLPHLKSLLGKLESQQDLPAATELLAEIACTIAHHGTEEDLPRLVQLFPTFQIHFGSFWIQRAVRDIAKAIVKNNAYHYLPTLIGLLPSLQIYRASNEAQETIGSIAHLVGQFWPDSWDYLALLVELLPSLDRFDVSSQVSREIESIFYKSMHGIHGETGEYLPKMIQLLPSLKPHLKYPDLQEAVKSVARGIILHGEGALDRSELQGALQILTEILPGLEPYLDSISAPSAVAEIASAIAQLGTESHLPDLIQLLPSLESHLADGTVQVIVREIAHAVKRHGTRDHLPSLIQLLPRLEPYLYMPTAQSAAEQILLAVNRHGTELQIEECRPYSELLRIISVTGLDEESRVESRTARIPIEPSQSTDLPTVQVQWREGSGEFRQFNDMRGRTIKEILNQLTPLDQWIDPSGNFVKGIHVKLDGVDVSFLGPDMRLDNGDKLEIVIPFKEGRPFNPVDGSL